MAKPLLHVKSFGASVKGLHHQVSGLPNQDAWCRANRHSGTMLVVCDGLGSAPLSQVGSAWACSCARKVFSNLSKLNSLEPNTFINNLENTWYSNFPEEDTRKYSTTCTVLFILKNTQSFWVSLGDGVIIAKENSSPSFKLTQNRELFGNITSALGTEKYSTDWQFGFLQNPGPGFCAMLASDGVGDDLDANKYSELLDYLHNKYKDMAPYSRWRTLSFELKHWNVPGHMDDKTLAFIWVQ